MTVTAVPAEATDNPWMPANPWACPAGELVLRYDAPREEWLAARRASIGASEVAAVFNLSKWDGSDLYSVWAEKMGHVDGKAQTRAMARGLIMEKAVVDLWIDQDIDFPIEVRRRGLMRSRTHPHIAASLDFLSVCPIGRCCIEVKTQNDLDTDEWDDDEIPLPFQFQGQAQLFVTGRDHVHVVGMGHRFEIEHRIMYRHQGLIDTMTARLDELWRVHFRGGVAPTPTARALDTVHRRHHTATDAKKVNLPEALWCSPKEDQELAARIKDLEERRAALAARVRDVAGDATVICIDGDPVATWNSTRKIVGADKKFIAANRDLVAPFMEPKPTLNAAALIEAHPELLAKGTLRFQRQFKWTV